MSYEKFTTALSMMDATIAEFEKVDWAQSTREIRTPTNTKWDELYTFVFANFKEPETKRDGVIADLSHEEVQSMIEMFKLNREEIEAELAKIPPTILEQCFPVWIARYLLCFLRMYISPIELTTFGKFHDLYGQMVIVGAAYRK